MFVDLVRRKEQKNQESGQGLNPTREANNKKKFVDRYKTLSPALHLAGFHFQNLQNPSSFSSGIMVKQINSASHSVNISLELEKISKYFDFEAFVSFLFLLLQFFSYLFQTKDRNETMSQTCQAFLRF
jgi:hypothetical protein